MRTQNLNSFPSSHQRHTSLYSIDAQQLQVDGYSQYGASRYQNPDSILKPSSNYNQNILNENNCHLSSNANLTPDEFKGMLAKELRSHFEMLRGELMESFSSSMRQYRNASKINNEEIQEIKAEITQNKNKFEELQKHILQVNHQFAKINDLYENEVEGIKSMIESKSLNGQYEGSTSNKTTQEQLERRFQALHQSLNNQIQVLANSKSKSKVSETILNELKELKNSYEQELRNNFNSINNRVKESEEVLNDILKKKTGIMERIRDDFVSSLDHQGMQIQEDIKHLERVLQTKCDENQAKVIIESELNKKLDPFKREMDHIKRTISSNQEEIERVDAQVNRKLENLDHNVQDKLFEISTNVQKGQNTQGINSDADRRITKLSQDSEIYHRTMLELKSSLQEVQEVFEYIQKEPKFNHSDDLAIRLESKINYLQNQIHSLSSQVDRQTYRYNNINQRNITPTHSPGAGLSKLTSPNITGITGVPSQYNRFNHPESYKENVNAFVPKYEEKTYQAKSPNEREREYNKSPYSRDYSPYSNKSNKGDISISRESSGSKYRQIKSSEAKNLGIALNGSEKKYYGDPKVKSVIEEFYKNRKQNQANSASKLTTPNEEQGKRSFRATEEIVTMSFEPRNSSSQIEIKNKSALEFQPNFGLNQNRENHILHSRSNSDLSIKEYERNSAHKKQGFGQQEQGNIKLDHKEPNFSLGSKSATSNLSMTYSTINPKLESTFKTEDFVSPQGSYRIPEEEKRINPLIKPTYNDYINLKKGTEQEFLANQFLNTQDLPIQLAHKQEPLQNNSREGTWKTRPSAVTSGGDTDQFHDAVDHFSDFDVNELNEGNNFGNFPRQFMKFDNRYSQEQENMKSRRETQESPAFNGEKNNQQYNATANEEKRKKDEKILAQIDYFIYGKLSNILNEDEEDDIYCNLDDDGFVFDEDGEYVLDKQGNKVQLTPEEIERFSKNNLIE